MPFPIDQGIDYIAQYPQLKNKPEFSEHIRGRLSKPTDSKLAPLEFNDVFRYVILLYSVNSPLLQIGDFKERKEQAAGIAGLEVEELINNPCLNAIIIGYIRMQRSPKWGKLFMYNEALYNQGEKLINGTTEPGEKTKNLVENIDDLELRIEKLISELTQGDPDESLTDDILHTMELDRLPSEFKPENVARALVDGVDIFNGWTPYDKV